MSVHIERLGGLSIPATPEAREVRHTMASREDASTRTADGMSVSPPEAADTTEAAHATVMTELVPADGEHRNARFGLWRDASRRISRVRVDPRIMGGQPTLGDTRIAVAQILGLLADGYDVDGVVDQFDGLIAAEDVREALLFAVGLSS